MAEELEKWIELLVKDYTKGPKSRASLGKRKKDRPKKKRWGKRKKVWEGASAGRKHIKSSITRKSRAKKKLRKKGRREHLKG